jgi:hypothetical protein
VGPRRKWEYDIKMELKKWGEVVDWIYLLRISALAGSCEHGNATSNSTEGEKCFDHVGDSLIIKKKSASWSQSVSQSVS